LEGLKESFAMSSRRFSQVPLSLWRKPVVKSLSDEAKLALMFYWCGPHSTSAGISVVPDAYAEADLGWVTSKWLKARLELQSAGLVKHDQETETVLVAGYLRANPPANQRMREAIVKQIGNLECDVLRELAEAEFASLEANAAIRNTNKTLTIEPGQQPAAKLRTGVG
jgi:hypothetical protein